MVGGSNHIPPDPSTNCPKCNATTLLALLFENCNALNSTKYITTFAPQKIMHYLHFFNMTEILFIRICDIKFSK